LLSISKTLAILVFFSVFIILANLTHF